MLSNLNRRGTRRARTRRAGRVPWITLFAVAMILAVVGGFVYAQKSPGTVGSAFMDALARGDVETLTSLTVLGDEPRDEIRRKWDFAVNKAGPYYRFLWKVDGAEETKGGQALVRVKVQRNVESGGSYDEPFQLPLVRTKDGWKVEVGGINREMFPGLPR